MLSSLTRCFGIHFFLCSAVGCPSFATAGYTCSFQCILLVQGLTSSQTLVAPTASRFPVVQLEHLHSVGSELNVDDEASMKGKMQSCTWCSTWNYKTTKAAWHDSPEPLLRPDIWDSWPDTKAVKIFKLRSKPVKSVFGGIADHWHYSNNTGDIFVIPLLSYLVPSSWFLNQKLSS